MPEWGSGVDGRGGGRERGSRVADFPPPQIIRHAAQGADAAGGQRALLHPEHAAGEAGHARHGNHCPCTAVPQQRRNNCTCISHPQRAAAALPSEVRHVPSPAACALALLQTPWPFTTSPISSIPAAPASHSPHPCSTCPHHCASLNTPLTCSTWALGPWCTRTVNNVLYQGAQLRCVETPVCKARRWNAQMRSVPSLPALCACLCVLEMVHLITVSTCFGTCTVAHPLLPTLDHVLPTLRPPGGGGPSGLPHQPPVQQPRHRTAAKLKLWARSSRKKARNVATNLCTMLTCCPGWFCTFTVKGGRG